MDNETIDQLRTMLSDLQEEMDLHANLIHLSVLLCVLEQERHGTSVEIRTIARALGFDRRTVSRAISTLSSRGAAHRTGLDLLSVEPSEDRRSRRVTLTAKGRGLANVIGQRMNDFVQASYTETALILCTQNGEIEWVNQAFTDLCGYQINELAGHKPGHILQGELTDKTQVDHIRAALQQREEITCELVNYHKDGRPYRVKIHIWPIENQGNHMGYVAQERLISFI